MACLQPSLTAQRLPHTFHHLSVDEGLSSGQYNERIVELEGMILIGSLLGLNFNDGVHNRIVRPGPNADSSGLYIARVPYGGFQIDRDGHCWFANGGGIIRYDSKLDSFQRFQPRVSITGDSLNGLWRWTQLDTTAGDMLWALNENSLLRLPLDDPLKAEVFIPGRFSEKSRIFRRGTGNYDFFALRRSKAFLHYYHIRRNRWDGRKDRRITTEDGAVLENILPADDELIWVATSLGVRQYDLNKGRWNYDLFPNGLSPPKLQAKYLTYADRGRLLVVATFSEGIHIFDLAERKYLGQLYDFQKGKIFEFAPKITNVTVIGEHRLFVSTRRNGVYYTDLRKMKLGYSPKSRRQEWANFKSIYRVPGEERILLLESKGVVVSERGDTTYWPLPITGVGVQEAMFVREDSKGRIWVGTLEWLFVKKPDDSSFQKIDLLPTELSSLPGYPAMIELPDGRLLFGTNEAEQFIVTEDLKKSYWLVDGKSTHSAYCLSDSQLIVGSARHDFLNIYRLIGHEDFPRLDTTIATPEMPLAIRHDAHRNFFWVVLQGKPLHVLFLKPDGHFSLEPYPIPGLDGIMSLELEGNDFDNGLWLSSAKGLFRYQPETGELIDFHYSDGLQGTEFIWFSSFRDHEGLLYFGGAKAVNIVDPERIASRIDLPRPTIVDLIIADDPNGLAKYTTSGLPNPRYVEQVTLPYDNNIIELSYSALEYSDPDFCRFRSRLIPDGDTSVTYGVATANTERILGPLAPGEYVLELLASNADGIWSEQPRRLRIVVEPPYWQEPWFITLAALFLMSILAWRIRVYYRRRLRLRDLTISEQNAYIEKEKALQEERDRLAKDMHDELGGGLTTIRLLLRKVKAKNPELKTGEELNRIDHHSSEIIKNMRFIVWALQRDNEQLDNFAAYLRHSIGGLLEDHDLEHGWRVSEELPDLLLTGTIRKNLWLCIKEATHNIIKHAGANFVTYRFDWDDSKGLLISVTDNGVGIPDLSDKLFGYGLKNMQDRMESIGGSADIQSIEGTTVTFQLPIATLPTVIAAEN